MKTEKELLDQLYDDAVKDRLNTEVQNTRVRRMLIATKDDKLIPQIKTNIAQNDAKIEALKEYIKIIHGMLTEEPSKES